MSVWSRFCSLIFQWLIEPAYHFYVHWSNRLPWVKKTVKPPKSATYLLSWYLPFLLTTSTFASLFFGNLLIENFYPFKWNKGLFLLVLLFDFLDISSHLWPFMVDGTETMRQVYAHIPVSLVERWTENDCWTSWSSFWHEVLAVYWFVCQQPPLTQCVAVCGRIVLFAGFHYIDRCETAPCHLRALGLIWPRIRNLLNKQWSPYLIGIRKWRDKSIQTGVSKTVSAFPSSDVLWQQGYRTDLNRFVKWSTEVRTLTHALLFLLNYTAQALETTTKVGTRNLGWHGWMAEVHAINLALKFTIPFADLVLAVCLTSSATS